jgi:hypothetical protein
MFGGFAATLSEFEGWRCRLRVERGGKDGCQAPTQLAKMKAPAAGNRCQVWQFWSPRELADRVCRSLNPAQVTCTCLAPEGR